MILRTVRRGWVHIQGKWYGDKCLIGYRGKVVCDVPEGDSMKMYDLATLELLCTAKLIK